MNYESVFEERCANLPDELKHLLHECLRNNDGERYLALMAGVANALASARDEIGKAMTAKGLVTDPQNFAMN